MERSGGAGPAGASAGAAGGTAGSQQRPPALAGRVMYLLRLGLRNLGRAKLRSVLALLGVLLGVSSVILMLAVGEGARSEAIRQIQELGSNNIILRSTKPSRESPDDTEGGMFPYGLTRDDFARVREIVPGVRLATATREHRREIRYRDRALDGRVVAVTPEYWQIQDIHLASGRFLGDLDARSAAAVAVLGADAAEVLFRADEPLGRSIRVGADQYYQVVGVAARRAVSPGLGSSLPAQDFNRDVYIPLPTDAARFGRYLTYHRAGELEKDGIELNQITLALEDISRVRETAGIVSDFLDEAHKQDDVAVTVPLDLLEKVEEAGRLFRLVLAAIASISLLVGGIGIMNIMLATVSERTREIGIRRALGATRADIIRQFLAESMLLSGCGGVAGILLGIVATWCLAFFVGVSTIVRPGAPLLAFGIALAVGLGFGTYPARRAAFLDPTEALRHE